MVHMLESVSENSLMRGISNAVPNAERSPLSGMQRNAKTMRAVRAILPSGRSAPHPARLAFDVSGSGTQINPPIWQCLRVHTPRIRYSLMASTPSPSSCVAKPA